MYFIEWRGKFYSNGSWFAEEKDAQFFTDDLEAFKIARRYVSANVYSVGE